VLFRDLFERLHYLSSVTTISTFALLMAILIKEGWGQATIKAILVFIVLLLVNAVLSHATARAARIHELGHWTPSPEEHIEGAEGGR
jgi:monovalent cation/proton antiporter MnhG/PhaG subunit